MTPPQSRHALYSIATDRGTTLGNLDSDNLVGITESVQVHALRSLAEGLETSPG